MLMEFQDLLRLEENGEDLNGKWEILQEKWGGILLTRDEVKAVGGDCLNQI
jgi:hypothetical protein